MGCMRGACLWRGPRGDVGAVGWSHGSEWPDRSLRLGGPPRAPHRTMLALLAPRSDVRRRCLCTACLWQRPKRFQVRDDQCPPQSARHGSIGRFLVNCGAPPRYVLQFDAPDAGSHERSRMVDRSWQVMLQASFDLFTSHARACQMTPVFVEMAKSHVHVSRTSGPQHIVAALSTCSALVLSWY